MLPVILLNIPRFADKIKAFGDSFGYKNIDFNRFWHYIIEVLLCKHQKMEKTYG